MRTAGPKNRISRRLATDIGFKTAGTNSHAQLLKKLNVPPGQHGAKGRRKVSDHSKQLLEKQKLRFMFGANERQMKNYFSRASVAEGNTGSNLCGLLEARLDNVVYRLGFAPTRSSARQLVSHGHISVNGKRVTVASFHVNPGMVVSFVHAESKKIPYIETSLERKDLILPTWLEVVSGEGKLIQKPNAELVESQVNMRLVIEFYSR